MRAPIVNAPAGYLAALEPLRQRGRLFRRLTKDLDFVQVFARDVVELRRHGARAIHAAKSGGRLWVAYPKGGKTRAMTDLPASPWWVRRDVRGEITGERGYKVAGLAKIGEPWTTLRLRKAGR
jgi:hypothetical protein